MPSKRPMFQRNPDTDTLLAMLQDASVGQVFTYEAMNRALGRPTETKSPPSLAAARRHLMKHKSLVFQCIKGESIRRASHQEVVEEVRAVMPRRLHAVTKWAGSRLGTVEYDTLDTKAKGKFNLAFTLGSAIQAASSSGSVKRIEAAVEKATKALPLSEALKNIGG